MISRKSAPTFPAIALDFACRTGRQGSNGGAWRLSNGHLRGARRQSRDRADQIRRSLLHRQFGDVFGRRAFAGRYRQWQPAALWHASRRTPGHPRASARPWPRALLLELHRGASRLRARRRRIVLRRRDAHHCARTGRQCQGQLHRARPVVSVRGQLMAGGAEGIPPAEGPAGLAAGRAIEQGSKRLHSAVRGQCRASRPDRRLCRHIWRRRFSRCRNWTAPPRSALR